jgi:hypothetical protein
MALGLIQPVTEMSTRNFPGGKGRPARRADSLAAKMSENVGASTSDNLNGLYRNKFTYSFYTYSGKRIPNVRRKLHGDGSPYIPRESEFNT